MPESEPSPRPHLARAAGAFILLAMVGFAVLLVSALRQAHAGLTTDQLLTFYAAPALAIVILGRILGGRLETRLRAATVLLATSGALLVAEALLIVGLHVGDNGAPMWLTTGGDRRSLLEITLDLRARGESAYPTIPGAVVVDLDPVFRDDAVELHPITPAPGATLAVLCNETGQPVTYVGDRFGFNNPDSSWETDPVDLVLIGDSYTQGSCVQLPDQFGSRLRSSWSLLNLGVRGTGPLQQLAILREYAASKTPEVVIWTYFEGNDLWEMEREFERAWLEEYLDPTHTQGLAAHHPAIDRLYASWIDSLVAERATEAGLRPPRGPLMARLAGVPRLVTLRRLIGFGVLRPKRGSTLGPLPDVLARAQADVEQWGGRLVLVYLPAYERYSMRLGEAVRGRGELRTYANERGITLIDLDSVFRARGDPSRLWAVPGGHLSAEGYRITAAAIRSVLTATAPDVAR